MNDNTIAGDVLWGAAAIANFLGLPRRAVYHAASRGALPVFRMGETLAARKSELLAWASGKAAA
jgi:hypothetical protein